MLLRMMFLSMGATNRISEPFIIPVNSKSPEKPHDDIPVSESLIGKTKRWGAARYLLLGAIIACVALAAIGILGRERDLGKLRQITNENLRQTVSVVLPVKAPGTVSLALPGETQAFTQAPIYAQASGYLKKWNYDIGAHVKAGQTLAEIDTPALDQQYAQAQANLEQAKAALWLSQSTYERYVELLKNKVIAAQDFDNQSGDYKIKQAAVSTDEANLKQIEALLAFKIVQAPFDGIVSSRNTDIGAFINVGAASPLFIVSQIDPLRVYVNVPQTMAASVSSGTTADVTFDTFPGRKFPAKVVATAGSINPSTRTLLTQLIIPNRGGELLPGSYVTVHLNLENGPSSLVVPANVLLFRSEGPCVGIVGSDNRVELRHIKIGRDLGDKLEITEGISENDRIILNPSDSLAAGTIVEVIQTPMHQSSVK
jgi:RND family efflux transporter MFP subunit